MLARLAGNGLLNIHVTLDLGSYAPDKDIVIFPYPIVIVKHLCERSIRLRSVHGTIVRKHVLFIKYNYNFSNNDLMCTRYSNVGSYVRHAMFCIKSACSLILSPHHGMFFLQI